MSKNKINLTIDTANKRIQIDFLKSDNSTISGTSYIHAPWGRTDVDGVGWKFDNIDEYSFNKEIFFEQIVNLNGTPIGATTYADVTALILHLAMGESDTLVVQTPAYTIASGDHSFDPQQIIGDKAIVQVVYSSIDTSDVQLELHQSPTGATYDLVEDTAVVIDKTKPSHSWNVRGLVPGVFLRVKVVKGTATAGVIDSISYLYE